MKSMTNKLHSTTSTLLVIVVITFRVATYSHRKISHVDKMIAVGAKRRNELKDSPERQI